MKKKKGVEEEKGKEKKGEKEIEELNDKWILCLGSKLFYRFLFSKICFIMYANTETDVCNFFFIIIIDFACVIKNQHGVKLKFP